MVRLFKIDIKSPDRLFLWVPAVNKIKFQVSQFPVSNSQFPISRQWRTGHAYFYRVSYGGYSCELPYLSSYRRALTWSFSCKAVGYFRLSIKVPLTVLHPTTLDNTLSKEPTLRVGKGEANG